MVVAFVILEIGKLMQGEAEEEKQAMEEETVRHWEGSWGWASEERQLLRMETGGSRLKREET